MGRALSLRANTMVTLFERCDAFRKPQRFELMLLAAECDFRGRGAPADGFRDKPFPQAAHLLAALAAARGVDAGAVAGSYVEKPAQIPQAVHQARVAAVRALLPAGGEESVDEHHGRP